MTWSIIVVLVLEMKVAYDSAVRTFFFFFFGNCIAPLGFLPWEILVVFP